MMDTDHMYDRDEFLMELLNQDTVAYDTRSTVHGHIIWLRDNGYIYDIEKQIKVTTYNHTTKFGVTDKGRTYIDFLKL